MAGGGAVPWIRRTDVDGLHGGRVMRTIYQERARMWIL